MEEKRDPRKERHKQKVTIVWSVIMAIVLLFLFIVTLVLTQQKFLYNTINSVLGGERVELLSGDPSQYRYYRADYDSKASVYEAANALNEKINEEGIVLLKNDEDSLPLPSGSRVTVFGKNASNIVLGGSGSNRGDVSQALADVTVALERSGFHCNPTIRNYYANTSVASKPEVAMGSILTGYPIGEAPLPYPADVTASYAQYHDAAIVVFSRMGGEGYDLPRTMFSVNGGYTNWNNDGRTAVPGARSMDDHYLQLDKNETDMLAEACANFGKVIVVINSASPMELGFLDDPAHYAYHDNIKAALWIGDPGNSGLIALGRVLNGQVSPSGRLPDLYARNFKNDPTWQNFGNYLTADGNRYLYNGKAVNAYFVEYREGIYTGYRYYETMAAEKNAASAGTGDSWYGENVVYPFGYGLSYTHFDWEVTFPEEAALAKDSELSVTVKVTNAGAVAGKDVVELYYTAPYKKGGIEKPHVVLGGFAKTGLLAAGESETLTLNLKASDMASYDYSDANGNGYKGYELEAGDYVLSVMRNSHDAEAHTKTFALAEDVRYTEAATGATVENLFDDVSGHIADYLSREDCFANASVLAGASSEANRTLDDALYTSLTWRLGDKETDPWYSAETPVQSNKQLTSGEAKVKLYDLIGKDYDDPMWEELLSQLTVDQMVGLVSVGNYRTVAIGTIGKMLTSDFDGPMGFAGFMGDDSVYSTCYYACETVLAASFNAELAKEFGEMIGNEGLIGNEAGDGRSYSGWYAPAVNLHRSPFGGRTFEYYSEDGLLSGVLAKNVVEGAKSKGVYPYVKHIALNEQETNRDTTGLVTWANEQAMRENYLKPFELCIVEGGATAVMSAFNRIGVTWAGGSYALLTKLLRGEWGFEGMVITDFNLTTYMNVDQMLRAGGDLCLSPEKKPSSVSTPTDVTVLRKATKNILYTVAGSNAMNGNGPGVEWGYALPWWVIWLIIANCVVAAIDVAIVIVAVISNKRERPVKNNIKETKQ